MFGGRALALAGAGEGAEKAMLHGSQSLFFFPCWKKPVSIQQHADTALPPTRRAQSLAFGVRWDFSVLCVQIGSMRARASTDPSSDPSTLPAEEG